MWSKMKCMVTGGAGLIGSNLVRKLASYGHEVVVIDNLWRGTLDNLTGIDGYTPVSGKNFHQCDLANFDASASFFAGVDTVFHLADIVAGIRFVFGNEPFVFRSNLLINSNTLTAAIEAKARRFIYVGTACSYPAAKQSFLNPPALKEEDAYPADPESGYGWSKLMGEYECELAHRYKLIETGILRLHNVYGGPTDISPERSQVIPALCRKAINFPSEEFVVWGSGTQRRSFIHVDDVVDAILLLSEKGIGAGAIQVGASESTSIKEIAEKVVKISGKKIDIAFDLSKPEGDKDRSPDLSKARNILGWKQVVTLDQGLERTYEWCERKLSS